MCGLALKHLHEKCLLSEPFHAILCQANRNLPHRFALALDVYYSALSVGAILQLTFSCSGGQN